MANQSTYGGGSSSRGGGRGGRGGYGRTQTRDFRREGGKDDYGPRGGMGMATCAISDAIGKEGKRLHVMGCSQISP